MGHQILIVEDQFIIAIALEDAVIEPGHEVVEVAANRAEAEKLCGGTDIALVDVNLLNGPTGPEIGSQLARHDYRLSSAWAFLRNRTSLRGSTQADNRYSR